MLQVPLRRNNNLQQCLIHELHDARLGYATINLATYNDRGRGPKIHCAGASQSKLQIDFMKSAYSANLIEKTSRSSYAHITLLVRSCTIAVNRLGKSKNHYPDIEWTHCNDDEINPDVRLAIIIDGNVRIRALREWVKDSIKDLPTRNRKLEFIERIGKWHCVLYDLGKTLMKKPICINVVTDQVEESKRKAQMLEILSDPVFFHMRSAPHS
jgi:hypothetical protein